MLVQADNATINAVVAMTVRTGERRPPYLRTQMARPLA
jgi:hypothetical protein